jgi:hypothetical protein
MLSVFRVRVLMLSVFKVIVFILSFVMLSVVKVRVLILSFVMLSIFISQYSERKNLKVFIRRGTSY